MAKWSVIVCKMATSGKLCAFVIKLERQVVEQRVFQPLQAIELVEFVTTHPMLNTEWDFCQGIS